MPEGEVALARPAGWSSMAAGRPRPSHGQPLGVLFTRFALVGASGTALNAVAVWFLHARLHLPVPVAGVLGAVLAIVNNFTLNNRWTFGCARWTWSRMSRFSFAALIGLTVNVALVTLLVERLAVHVVAASLFATAVVMWWNFGVNLVWTWSDRDGHRGGAAPLEVGDVAELVGHARPSDRARSERSRWIVIPAHNEEARLGSTLGSYLGAIASRDRLVVVVNGSTDATADIAWDHAARDPRLHVIVEPGRIGKGGAIMRGVSHVVSCGHPEDVVAYTDADGAVGAAELLRVCAGVEPRTMVVGSRWLEPDLQVRRQPLVRRIASRTFNRLVRGLVGLDLEDTQCAAKALRVADAAVPLALVTSTGFCFDVDLLLAASVTGLRVAEVPVEWRDQDGSTVDLRRAAPAMLREVIRLRRRYAARRDLTAPAGVPDRRGWECLAAPELGGHGSLRSLEAPDERAGRRSSPWRR